MDILLQNLVVNPGVQRYICKGVAKALWGAVNRGNRFLNGTCHYIIQINPSLLAQETLLLPGSSQQVDMLSLFAFQGRLFPQVFSHRKEFNTLLDRSIAEAEQPRFCSETILKALALEIAVSLLRESKAEPSREHIKRDAAARKYIQEILAYLSNYCTQPELVTLQALSHHFGLSASYLCRLFKQQTNLTLNQYINELRCAKAASLLQDGFSLQEVALATGFQDYNYFSRLFKKSWGRLLLPTTAARGPKALPAIHLKGDSKRPGSLPASA